MSAPLATSVLGIFIGTAILLVLVAAIVGLMAAHNKKIRDSEAKFRSLFSNVYDVLVLVDRDRLIADVNNSVTRTLDYERQELLGRAVSEMITEGFRRNFSNELEKVFRSGLDHVGAIELKSRGGQIIQAEVGCVPLKISGKPHVLASFRDMTRCLDAERKLEAKNAALREIMDQIKRDEARFRAELEKSVETVLLPGLDKLASDSGRADETALKLMKTNLFQLIHPTDRMAKQYAKLSPRETEVCRLVESGATGKEIARALGLSEHTIGKHKERIRKKLGISHLKANLASYLKNPPDA